MILGTDHSHWDWITGEGEYVPIDYQRAYDSGSRFVIIKVVNGSVIQERAPDELARAYGSPLCTGMYGWVFPVEEVSALSQARACYESIKLYKGMPLFLDLEETIPYSKRNPTSSDALAVAKEFEKLDAAREHEIVIYSREDYLNTHGGFEPLKAYRKWLARYNNTNTPPDAEWLIWQFSRHGDPIPYGVDNGKTDIDLNYFHSDDYNELVQFFGGTPPPPQEETMNKVTIIASVINVRSGPSTSAAILRQLKAGNVVYTPFEAETKPVSGQVWIRITESPVEYVAVGDALSKVESVPGGGEIKPVITFHLSAVGYPNQDVTWTPL